MKIYLAKLYNFKFKFFLTQQRTIYNNTSFIYNKILLYSTLKRINI